MSDQELSPEMQSQMDHLAGKQVVVEYVYADGKGTRFLLESLGEESDAAALWDDVAFTNGPPLVEIRMRWDQTQADALREHFVGQSVSTDEQTAAELEAPA